MTGTRRSHVARELARLREMLGALETGSAEPPPFIDWALRVPEPKSGKVRLHVDVTLEPGQEIPDLLKLGATIVTEPGEQRWWVLADPEGHEFCAFLPESDATNDADAEV